MASTPDESSGHGPGAAVAPPPPVPGSPTSLAELQRAGHVTPAQGVAIFDGLLAALIPLEESGRRAGRLDAFTVLADIDGTVLLTSPAGVPAEADAPTDVPAAALVVRPLVSPGGRRFRRVRHLVDAAVEGRAARSVSDLRRQLAAAAAPLGPGWNDPGVLAPLFAAPPLVQSVRRRRRWPWFALAAAVVMAGAAAALWFTVFAAQSPSSSPAAHLSIGTDMKLTVSPGRASCNTTFVFHATASVSGAGLLVYRWEQSDGQTSDNQSVRVTTAEASFDVTQSWRIQGAQTLTGKETFHILQPVDRTLTASFQYQCP